MNFNLKSAITILIILFFCISNSRGQSQGPGQETYGIDVSRYQGKIDWSQISKYEEHKIEFVYIKATEGASLIDNSYKINFDGAKKNHFLVGSYHFFRAKTPAKLQYDNFVSQVNREDQDLIPIVDVEEMNGCKSKAFQENFKLFLKLVENEFGKKPMIYTSNSFYNKHLSLRFKGYRFFIGRYSLFKPFMADGHDWTIWQFTETGKMNGIAKHIDVDVMNEKFNISCILLK